MQTHNGAAGEGKAVSKKKKKSICAMQVSVVSNWIDSSNKLNALSWL